jgi:preprotein translocase SecE subunit
MMGKRLNSVGSGIKAGAKKVTRPVRENKVWKFLRRTILRSPFKGYFVDSWRELRKVEWPNRKKALQLTFTVILFSAVFAVFTTSLDFAFEKLAKQIFLK